MTKPGERAAQREREAEVLDLFADGFSVVAISRRLAITPQQAARRLSAALAELPEQPVEDLRAGVEVRLDRAAAGLAVLAARTDDDRVLLQALTALARIESDRTRLLGLAQKPPPEDA
ncbi:helix-turn-helix domain-containing protein [Microlunatus antarcticus]|uniref:DNA invertase Pin-like site-specific DNA recombinase n=1 Tax=Microlunatus antarcticus TaxID=53388 RepID=A0A7W5P7I9_9ACTN|nr:hypothetical protein [Microlunatus antarcticus]MBB3327472.1 DNA invertase Pin-like site-specific DNA recombinase [Microlunatus antarcticus]